MALGESELAVVLQAAIDCAGERLREEGGFLPFGARARTDGEVEFLEFADTAGQPLEALHSELVATLSSDRQRGDILAAGLAANVGLPGGGDFATAIAVQVETDGFCRLVVVPYRLAGDEVETGPMSPQDAQPLVFA